MTGPRDWDKELAAIDKAIDRMPTEQKGGTPAPAGAPRGQAQSQVPVVTPVPRRAALTTWLRVWLVLALAIAAPFWPYPHACGLNLFMYLGVVSLVVIAGAWGAINSWQRRLGLAHVLSLLTILWGAWLVLAEILPRVGYAAAAMTWGC
jgi:hypothetical protein